MRSRRSSLTVLTLFSLLLAHGGAAYASPGDPPAGSPSGSVYQLPLEKGRSDAAPAGGGGTSAPGEPSGDEDPSSKGGSDEGSFYRSENNFGSSSEVPGDSRGQQGGPGAASNGSGPGGSGGGPSDSGGSGSSGSASGTNTAGASDSGNTSIATSVLLLVAIGAIGIGVAVFAARSRRPRAQS